MSTRKEQLLREFLIERNPPVVEWLQENVRLPRRFSPRSPGRFSTAQRPYMRPILETFHPESGVNDCVVVGATQLLKTTVLNLGLAYNIHWDPQPTLIVLPTLDFARNVFSRMRLQPLIDENPSLSSLKPLNPDDYAVLRMDMQGGSIDLVGSNSPTGLSGRPVCRVLQDECCKFEHRTSEDAPEAHPIELADERTKDFDILAFRYKSSSPNVETHPFWSAFERGSQTQFYVPCPSCGEFFLFEFKKDDETGYTSVVWDADAKDTKTGLWIEDRVKESAKYVCPHCGFLIRNADKPAMLEAAEQHHGNPLAPSNYRSFQISSFYSPRITFGDMAVAFLKGHSEIDGLRNFYNSWLAENWHDVEVNVKDDAIRALRSDDYRKGTVPFEPAYLLTLADPGMMKTHWMNVAIAKDTKEIAVIDWGTVLTPEDLATPESPRFFEYPIAGTNRKASAMLGLTDSNFLTDRVYRMCYTSGGFWQPTRGSDATIGHWTEQSVKTFPGMNVIVFVDHTLKTALYKHRIQDQGAPRVYLPADASQELMGQLMGQKLVKGKKANAQWKRLPNDHWGDCLKQAILAEWICHLWNLAAIEQRAAVEEQQRARKLAKAKKEAEKPEIADGVSA